MTTEKSLNEDVEITLDLILAEFDQSVHEASRQITRISADNRRISGLCDQLGGIHDSHDLRARLNATIEVNKQNVGKLNETLQSLSQRMDFLPDDKKIKLRLLLREYQPILENFQQLQKMVVNKSKEFVSQAQIMINSEAVSKTSSEEREPLMTQQTTTTQERQLVNEISYNQALIIEREHGIQEIQAAMNEINSIFKDIGTLVTEQQLGFDNIAENVEMISSRTRNAANEIRIAEDYRRRRPLVNCWWFTIALLLSLIVIAFILSL